MGIYYRTVFYKDVRNRKEGYIILADMDPILEGADRERGYVLKEQILDFYGKKVRAEDITGYSRIEEQVGSSYEPGYDTLVSLPIR